MATRYTADGLRPFIIFNNILIWISAVIVMGILSYFIHLNGNLGEHVVYEQVIAVLTVAFYIPALFLPGHSAYRGHFLPLNLIFSYLWLTSFIFAAEDYTWQGCEANWPVHRCSLKHTVEAFNFLAFFFLLCNVLVEAALFGWHWSARRSDFAYKERPATASTTAPTTAAAAGPTPAAAPAVAPNTV